MQAALALAATTLLAITGHGDADVSVCKQPTPVEAFAASFYTALILDHDPDIVDTLSVTGKEAAMLVYRVTTQALDYFKYRKCDAEEIGFIASLALAHFDNLTLPNYFAPEASTVGNILYEYGVLDCSNAVQLSLEYLTYGRNFFNVLDPHKFDSYMTEIIWGGIQLYIAHGLNLETVIAPTADVFHQKFTENKKAPKCTFGNSTM